MWKSVNRPETVENLFNLVFGTSREEGVNTKLEHITKYDEKWLRYKLFTNRGYFPNKWPRRLYK